MRSYADWLKNKKEKAWEDNPGSTEWKGWYDQSNAVSEIVNTILYGVEVWPLPNEREQSEQNAMKG